MANEQNLIPNSERTPSERRENARKAGVASGQSRRRKKYLHDTVEMLLSLSIHEGKLDKLTSLDTISNKNVTVEERLILKQIEKASKGDLQSFNALMNLVANKEQPTQETKTAESSGDDSFMAALNAKAAEVWNEETDKADTV